MILSHARLPIPTLPRKAKLATDDTTEKVNQKLTKKLTSDIVEAFLKSRRQGISKNTVLFYQRCLTKAIGIDLTPTAINWFLSTLSCKNGKFAYYRAIRALCNWLHRQGYLEVNPIKLIDRPSVSKKMLPSVTEEQVHILLEAAESQRDRCIVSLLFDSGLRLSELCAIKQDDIDWKANILTVMVKGNREAKAVFTSRTARFLRDYISNNGHNHNIFGTKPRGVQDMLSRLTATTGIKCNAHSFRRGFACNLHKKGLSTLSIMHLGRWSSLDMVTRYTKSITFDDCLELYKQVNGSKV
jgi:integrase